MDISKVFQCRNISTTCEHISKYCELYINSSLNPSSHNVRSFHTFFPTLLVYIFGSPNVRGWAQIETLDHEDEAIKKLLSVKGHFFQALIKLSQFPEYSYDLVTDALPADVKRLLSTGAIHILPNVYKNCTYLSTSAINKSVDIKAAATRQSTLLAPFGGERRIKFNMIQFYLYYFASVATWSPQPVINTNPTNIPNTSNQPNQSVSTSALYSRFSNNSPSVNNTPNPSFNNNNYSTNQNYPHLIPGKARAVSYGVYSPVLEEYMSELIPIGIREDFPPIIQSFFFDVLMELFIRVTYVPVPYQALSSDLLFFITAFVKFIVRHDLRQYGINPVNIHSENSNMSRKSVSSNNITTPLISRVYLTMKDELCLLISRLALNYKKDDDYLSVIDLWAVWAAPWKFGVTPRSSEKYDYMPIQHGWAAFILDNLPFYLHHTDIFLQRASTFMYKDSYPPNYSSTSNTGQLPSRATSNISYNGTIRGQLRILYRIINVIKANGLLEFLGYIEKAIERLQMGSSAIDSGGNSSTNYFKQLSMIAYGTENMDSIVCQKLKAAYDFSIQVENSNWKPKGLFTNDIQPRSEALLKTVGSVYSAFRTKQTESNSSLSKLQLNSTAIKDTKKYMLQLGEAYELLTATFKVMDSAVTTYNALPSDANPTASNSAAGGTAINTSPTATANNLPQRKPYIPKYASLNENGFLREQDKLAIMEGKVLCSHNNVRAVGIRAETHVRSYEVASLVALTLKVDKKMNYYYDRYLPLQFRPGFLPRKLTVRFLACPKNLFWTTVLLAILYKIVL